MSQFKYVLLGGLASFCLTSLPVLAQDINRQPLAFLDSADTNHDGLISLQEFVVARDGLFDKLDRNHDGAFTTDDYKRLKRFRPQAAERLDGLLQSADSNHDGRATREEWHNAPPRLFDRIDANHDGSIDAKELAAAKASRAQ